MVYARPMGMNYIQRIFLTALIFSALLLGWVYLLGLIKPDEPTSPKWAESLSSLHDLYRITYRQSRNTLQQASIAQEDSLAGSAIAIRAIAESERINCRICQQAIEALGDKVTAPSVPNTELTPTAPFVEQKIGQKSTLNRSTLPEIIERLLGDENRYVARLLTWYNSNNNQQMILLEICRAEQNAPSEQNTTSVQNVPSSQNKTSRANAYRVCPTCGYITLEEFTPHCCPHCMTRSEEFVLFK